MSLLKKRLEYLWSVVKWSIKHRSLSRGRWVAAFEGKTWASSVVNYGPSQNNVDERPSETEAPQVAGEGKA